MYEPVPQVDIPGLSRVGSAVEAASVTWGKAHSTHAEQLPPGDALTGWAAGAALATANDGWSAFMTRLEDELHAYAAGLTQSAKDYQAADEAAAAGVYRGGGAPR
ncbi:hypothetical protein [Actinoplanes sp. NPDC049316]|uniref:hypothetical protein n=1 Tax=Actinoplanes sp. NPDC049316 TaxID=3154727 RepID=UPI0034136402